MSSQIRRMRPLLGTFVSISCAAPEPANAQRALEAAFGCFAMVDRCMHPTRAGSDLATIREAPLGHPIQVHPWTWQVLALSRHLNALSRGRFDPCLPEAGRITQVELPEPDIVVCRAPVAVDLGGIAKGFAVDRAVDALADAGCRSGAVNAGGDLRVFGEPQVVWIRIRDGAWPITLDERACAVSDPAQGSCPAEHRGYYNRATATPINARAAVVVAPTAALADGLTKWVLFSSEEDAARLTTVLRNASAELLELPER